ncbi:MAG: SusC/RagA family TonB-linked outer membrane protein [Gemmatimonadaceae bacterium]|nr:SusC/RagA family TonB-linked outer membrane protein [Gemmatimonadaceae bacterium]
MTAGAQVAAAQAAVFAGRVTTQGQPIGGASVGIPEIGVGSNTSADGRYSFTIDATRYRGRTLNFVVRYIGYKPKRVAIAIAPGRVDRDFDLERDVLNLDQVVVTGVSDATSQKKTAFAVAVVDNTAIKEVPAISPVGSLAGRVAGASVTAVSGSPGGEPAIRLRSATSLTGSQNPLIIVDGTITRLGLADINSQDIDHVEVIKGAAASSLYGSDAANGVIQIFTKRGANLSEGQVNFQFRNEYGQSYLPKKVGLNTSTAFQLDPSNTTGLSRGFKLDDNGQRISEPDDISDNSYPVVYDALGAVFKPGATMTNYISIGQRKGGTNFNASVQNTQETGVLTLLKGYSRQNFRINVDQAITEKINLSTGMFYGRSTNDQTNEGSLFFGVRFLEPNIDITANNADGTPYLAAIRQPPSSGNLSNPLYRLANQTISEDRNRFTGTAKVSYRPFEWLTAEGNFNYDQSTRNNKNLIPIGFLNSIGGTGQGYLSQRYTGNRAFNTGATLTATKTFGWLTNTTKLATVYEDQAVNFLRVEANKLTVGGVTEFGAAAKGDLNAPNVPTSESQTIRNQNYFAITTFDIKDRYVIDGLVRRDASSLFGSENRSATYVRASGAWRFTEDFKIPGVDEGKLRVSYGTAGLRPQFDAQYETFSIDGGSPSKVTLGNPNLKPAFSQETEAGFNINFLRNYSFEYSYSKKNTRDQILKVPTSSGTGYQNTWVNAATLDGATHEFAFGAVLASKKDFFWRLNITGDRTRSKITELNVADFLVGPDPNDGNTRIFRVAAGQTFGVIYGSDWIRTADQLATNITNGTLTGTASDYQLNELGYYVAKSAYGTAAERPLKYFDANGVALRPIGDVNPDFTMGFSNTLQWKGFTMNGVVTWQKGGQIYNYTRQWPYNELRDTDFDQRNAAVKKPQGFFQAFYNNFDPNSKFVEDGGFVRLRELALNYQIPKSIMRSLRVGGLETARVGIVGRNLWTHTKYSGYDPDVTGPGGDGSPFGYRVDYFTYPAYRTFTMMLELGF